MNLVFTTPDGRAFRLVDLKPHARKDGTPTTLAVWRSTCEACGHPFEVTTPADLKAVARSKAFGIKHCPAHRLTAAQALERANRARRPA
jgi:hypothetical protein